MKRHWFCTEHDCQQHAIWKRKNQILSCDESLNHSQTKNKNNPNKNGKMNTVVLPKSWK
jgi:hypothetical protein